MTRDVSTWIHILQVRQIERVLRELGKRAALVFINPLYHGTSI
jgi:hypothetical protein